MHSELYTVSVVRSLRPRLQTDVSTKLPLLLSYATVPSHLSDSSQMGHGLKGVTAVGLAEDVPQKSFLSRGEGLKGGER